MMRGEVLDGPERRRRWSEDEKTAILAELAKPGSKGAEVARRYGVSRGLLYTWRKEAGAARHTARPATEAMAFAPVLLTGPAAQAETPTAPAPPLQSPPFIEIEMKGARVRLPGNAPASTVTAAIKALRGRS